MYCSAAPVTFQHTAARRRLATVFSGYQAFARVSTHSRPKAAGIIPLDILISAGVSTHSRPKAAGIYDGIRAVSRMVSTHSRPKAAGNILMSLLHLFVVSTHSRPKAAGCGQKPEPKPPMRFQHTAARRRLVSNISTATASACFNTQPPEGGWFILAGKIILYWLFQHTAARRRLGGLAVLFGILLVFQHTAARRRLDFRDGKVVVFGRVSTHSRPKAAGCNDCFIRGIYAVSTHSRPKAAGIPMFRRQFCQYQFQHTAARRRLANRWPTKSNPARFQHTAARRRLADTSSFCFGIFAVSTHSRPKAAGS